MNTSQLEQSHSVDLTGLDPSTQQYIRSLWIAEDYDDYFSPNALFRYDIQFLEKLFPTPTKLVDLGCGTGRVLVPFVRRGHEATGVDISDSMLRITEEKLHEAGLQARLIKSNLCQIPELPDGSFDAAISMFSTLGMIQGAANRLACVQEVCRLLRPGGIFVFHGHSLLFDGWTPETWVAWVRSLGLVFSRGMDLGDKFLSQYRGIPDMYLHTFRPGEVRRLLAKAGLRLVRTAYLNRARNGELGPVFFRAFRANGFIFVARKPEKEA